MRKRLHKLLALTIGAVIPLSVAFASDYYDASGVPAARSLLNSADMRAEFLAIQTGISEKLPALTGNGGLLIAVNSGGTALEALAAGVTIAQGGTGATTAAGARTALGLAIGTDVQAYDADLGVIAGLSNGDGNFIVGSGAAWVAESGATARASLGLTIGTNVQAYDAQLADIAALAVTDGNFIVADGANWVAESAATARTSLGLGSLATLSSIDNDNWDTTDLAVVNGGTGASDAGTARTNLGLGSLATLSSINNSNWSGTDLSVANGGTGASTLTGLLQGNGTGAITGSATINNGDWSGTDLAVANGGTGASDADTARTNLDAADLEITQNTQNGNYTLVAADSGRHIYKSSGGAGETITIPANASVAYDVGTVITIINNGGGTLSIAITSDTLILANDGSTGTRTLADNGLATIIKVASTTWFISGAGVT